jgi:hypothetical protein
VPAHPHARAFSLLFAAAETLNVCQKIIGLQPAGEAAAGGASAADAGSPQVVVAGCIFKDQKLRPSILDAYSGACSRLEPAVWRVPL